MGKSHSVTLMPGHTSFLSVSFPSCKTDIQSLPCLLLARDLFFRTSYPKAGKGSTNVGGSVRCWKAVHGFGLQMSAKGVEMGGTV